jgi:hypothetical protein
MKNNMPIWNTYANVAQRLRNYVANGNHLILTGGSLVSIEFLNRSQREIIYICTCIYTISNHLTLTSRLPDVD